MASITESQIALRNLYPPFDSVDVDESHVGTTGSQVQLPETQASLPAVDGGKEAWLFLAGSFFIEALVWGKWLFCQLPQIFSFSSDPVLFLLCVLSLIYPENGDSVDEVHFNYRRW